jgi:hypothetical protein
MRRKRPTPGELEMVLRGPEVSARSGGMGRGVLSQQPRNERTGRATVASSSPVARRGNARSEAIARRQVKFSILSQS